MIKVQYDSLTGAVIAAYDSPLEVSAPFVEVSESEWNAVAGRKVKVSGGILVCDLDAAKKEAARRLWENYKSFQTQYVDAEDLTLAVVCANGGSAKGKAVMMWVMNLWAAYYQVKDRIAAAETLSDLDAIELTADAHTPPPYTIRELNEEAANAAGGEE